LFHHENARTLIVVVPLRMSLAIAGTLVVVSLLITGAAVAQAPAPTLTLTSASVTAKWREGWLQKGRVVLRGSVEGPARLQAVLRPAQPGKVTALARITVARAGPYKVVLRLPKRPRPGTYQATVSGQSGSTALPKVERDVLLPAPAEGIVDTVIVSATANGAKKTVLRGRRHQVFVRFHFFTPPNSRKVAIVWRTPSYRFVCQTSTGPVRGCKLVKPYATTIRTFLRSRATPLQKGTWYCILHVGNKIAKRAAVRLR
jgi:hypothetical protein